MTTSKKFEEAQVISKDECREEDGECYCEKYGKHEVSTIPFPEAILRGALPNLWRKSDSPGLRQDVIPDISWNKHSVEHLVCWELPLCEDVHQVLHTRNPLHHIDLA